MIGSRGAHVTGHHVPTVTGPRSLAPGSPDGRESAHQPFGTTTAPERSPDVRRTDAQRPAHRRRRPARRDPRRAHRLGGPVALRRAGPGRTRRVADLAGHPPLTPRPPPRRRSPRRTAMTTVPSTRPA